VLLRTVARKTVNKALRKRAATLMATPAKEKPVEDNQHPWRRALSSGPAATVINQGH
jgi:hypothetical protein